MLLPTPEWLPPPTDLDLPQGAVHIWRVGLDVSATVVERLAITLSPDERQRVARFRFERDRRRFTVGRGVLRAILGGYLRLEPVAIEFCYSAMGKPAIAHPPDATALAFNLSHCQDWMICAVTWERRVGIDLEAQRSLTDLAHLTQRFFAPAEHEAIQALPPAQQLPAFFQYWTVKEALLKATGDGLADLSRLTLQMTVTGARIAQWAEMPDITGWELQLFCPVEGFTAAIAVETDPTAIPHQISRSLVFWQWQDGKQV